MSWGMEKIGNLHTFIVSRRDRKRERVDVFVRIVHRCDDFGGAAVSQPPKGNVCNVSIVRSNLFGAWKALLLWLRPPDAL